MSSSNDLKANGARLFRLIVDVGTETMRKHFDSIHPPANLPAVLNANRATLDDLHNRRIIKKAQWNLLFPPPGMPLTGSEDYDITLLFILLRNICGLSPPKTADGLESWNQNPPLSDHTVAADLTRINFYRNTVFAHIKKTEVSKGNFNRYWSEISRVLERLSKVLGDDEIDHIRNTITHLRIDKLDEGTDWFENDSRLGNLMQTNQEYLKWIIFIVAVTLVVLLFDIRYDTMYHNFLQRWQKGNLYFY